MDYNSSIFLEFAKVAQNYPSQNAISFRNEDSYFAISYCELFTQAVRLGNLLYRKGIKESDRVAILFANQPEWPLSFMAVQYLGCIAVPIDTKLNPADICQLIWHSQSKAVLCSQVIYTALKDNLSDVNAQFFIVDSKECSQEIEAASSQAKGEHVNLSQERVAAIFYTSGTANTPKGVLLSESNLLANVKSIKKLKLASHNDVFISLLPLHHTYSFMVTCLFPLLTGAQVSYPMSINSENILDCMRQTRVSILAGVPQLFLLFHSFIKEKLGALPLIIRWLTHVLIELLGFSRRYLKINLNKYFLSPAHRAFGGNLRLMVSGGAKLDDKVARDFFNWGFTILEGYGLTETSPVVTFNTPDRLRAGSIGRPIPDVQVRIVDPDKFGVGEIAVKGPNVMLGYYGLPDETQAAIKEGWFFTQDLGCLDKNNYLFIKGRRDELIVLPTGKKINPEVIEKHYSKSEFIKEIGVFTLERQGRFGSIRQIVAVVVPDEEHFRKQGQLNVEEKIKWEIDELSYRLSNFMRVKGFVISTNDLPRTRLGKIMRYKLPAMYLEKMNPQMKKDVALNSEDLILLSSPLIQKVLKYLSDYCKAEVSLYDHLELDLGLDSLGRVELLLKLQQLLSVKIPDSVTMELFYAYTIRDLFHKVKPYLPKELSEPAGEEDGLFWRRILNQEPSAELLGSIRTAPTLADKLLNLVGMSSLRLFMRLFFRLRVKGSRGLPKDGPFIIYANHASYLDGFILAAALPFKFTNAAYFVGFGKYFLHPLIRSLTKSARLIPIDVTLELPKAMQACSHLSKNKKIICYFPEGQRCSDGKIHEFKRGIGILAKELCIPVVPAYIEGAFESWPRFRKLPKLSKIKVVFGKVKVYSEEAENVKAKPDIYEGIAKRMQEELISLSP